MEPEDKVQPLDWTGGVLHAILFAEAETASWFVVDYMFYHHISNEYIQKLRRPFVRNFKALKPRFIIQIEADKPYFSGLDTTSEFEE